MTRDRSHLLTWMLVLALGLGVTPVTALPADAARVPDRSFALQDDDDVDDDAGDDDAGDDADVPAGDDDGAVGDDGADDDDTAPAVQPVGPAVTDDDGDPATDGYIASQAVVRLDGGADLAALNARYGTVTLAEVEGRPIALLALPPTGDDLGLTAVIATDGDVAWAEVNGVGSAPEGRPQEFFLSGTATLTGSADHYAPELIGATRSSCATGEGVTVAVIDTGVEVAHPLLDGRLGLPGRNLLTGGEDIADLGDGLDNDADGITDEMTGHGTHVAGIIAQVAPGATILPIKALDSDGSGEAFRVARAIFFAIDAGADVINLSLGSTRDTRVIADAVAEARAAGIVVVAAAGNADRATPVEFPAADDNVIGIAATDAGDRKSTFSNYHAGVDLSAPGTDIASAYPGQTYAVWSGTSMSTPFVAAGAALLLEQNPSWSPERLVDHLGETAQPFTGVTADTAYAGLLGAGRLDVAAATACEDAPGT